MYVPPAKVMKVFISACEVPVRLGPEKQITANSMLLPLGTRARAWISEMGSSILPRNGAVTVLVAGEMLKVCPLAMTARKTAEPWNPAGHAVVVAQVGLLPSGPLAGFSATVAVPPLVLGAELLEHALERITPIPIATALTSHLVKRPFLLPAMSCIPALFGLYHSRSLYRKWDAELGCG